MMVIQNLAYLVAAVLFILGLKDMAHPRRAVRGNYLAAIGMGVAILFTLMTSNSVATTLLALAMGSGVGVWLALKVPMTAMPQMVALLNGLGGLASVLVAGAEMTRAGEHSTMDELLAIGATALIGGVTFSGSILAYGKLEEWATFQRPWALPNQQLLTAGLGVLTLLLIIILVPVPTSVLYWLIVLISLVLGILLVEPIGGADMPVVIALLNSYSGLAAAAAGFVIYNNALIIAGSLVGASGIILTQIMCKAMNRSLTNVLFAKFEAKSGGPGDEIYATVRSASADDVALILDAARRVVIVPGYGLAVAQAQHAVRDLANLLQARGIEVEYAIHPVAGRMPGHMNVLLAEADIPYEKLREMDDINPTMDTVDVAVVIGANDVVNPLARHDKSSPIYGMPILDVDKARTVIVIKRSLSPGFAKIPNPLFAAENALMFYGDGKKAIMDIIAAIKSA